MNLPDRYIELFSKAIETWGEEFQIRMAYEECGELIAALAQWQRGRDVNVIEEIADVYLVVHQLRLMFGTTLIDSVIQEKMDRLSLRLSGFWEES